MHAAAEVPGSADRPAENRPDLNRKRRGGPGPPEREVRSSWSRGRVGRPDATRDHAADDRGAERTGMMTAPADRPRTTKLGRGASASAVVGTKGRPAPPNARSARFGIPHGPHQGS